MQIHHVLISAYTPRISAISHDGERPASVWKHECAEIGGFNPHTSQLTKICCSDSRFMTEHLDHITAAVEAGVVKTRGFMEQIFASQEDFNEFLEYLLVFPLRVHDRWHQALAHLAGKAAASDSLRTTRELVEVLREAALR